jgi:glycosyltransferase involved in cell wall biosynthesis
VILFFTGSQGLKGGTERACADTASMLSDMGHQATILSSYGGKKSHYYVKETVVLDELFVRRKRGVKGFIASLWKLFFYVYKFQPRVIIAVESISFLYFIPLLILPNRPKLVNWEHFNAEVELGVRARRYSRWLASRFADHIVVLSHRDSEIWPKKFPVSKNKLAVIYNVNPFSTYPHISAENKAISNRVKRVIAVGRLTHQKGFDLLVKAWSEIDGSVREGWDLAIFGEGEDRSDLEELIRSNGLDDIFLHGQSNSIEKEFKSSDVFVLPSRFEGFGLVVVEALSCGLPVVSFDCNAGPSEIITDGVNGMLVPNGDVEGLSKSLADIMDDGGKRMSMSSMSGANLDKFTMEEVSKGWQSLLNDVER